MKIENERKANVRVYTENMIFKGYKIRFWQKKKLDEKNITGVE